MVFETEEEASRGAVQTGEIFVEELIYKLLALYRIETMTISTAEGSMKWKLLNYDSIKFF